MPSPMYPKKDEPKHGLVYKIIEGLAIAYIIGASIVFLPTATMLYTALEENDSLYAMSKRLLKTNDYLFNAANSRGLLEICENADGEMGVIFKEDCKK